MKYMSHDTNFTKYCCPMYNILSNFRWILLCFICSHCIAWTLPESCSMFLSNPASAVWVFDKLIYCTVCLHRDENTDREFRKLQKTDLCRRRNRGTRSWHLEAWSQSTVCGPVMVMSRWLQETMMMMIMSGHIVSSVLLYQYTNTGPLVCT